MYCKFARPDFLRRARVDSLTPIPYFSMTREALWLVLKLAALSRTREALWLVLNQPTRWAPWLVLNLNSSDERPILD